MPIAESTSDDIAVGTPVSSRRRPIWCLSCAAPAGRVRYSIMQYAHVTQAGSRSWARGRVARAWNRNRRQRHPRWAQSPPRPSPPPPPRARFGSRRRTCIGRAARSASSDSAAARRRASGGGCARGLGPRPTRAAAAHPHRPSQTNSLRPRPNRSAAPGGGRPREGRGAGAFPGTTAETRGAKSRHRAVCRRRHGPGHTGRTLHRYIMYMAAARPAGAGARGTPRRLAIARLRVVLWHCQTPSPLPLLPQLFFRLLLLLGGLQRWWRVHRPGVVSDR